MVRELQFRQSLTLALLLASSVGTGAAQVWHGFHRTFAVSLTQPVSLDVVLVDGDLRIAYARDGVVDVSLAAQNATTLDPQSLSSRLVVAQSGNRLELREQTLPGDQELKLTYTIDVPYRTAVHTSIRRGRQKITGILGPVNTDVGQGDAEISYVSLGVAAHAQTGNLSFEVVGGKIEARTGQGQIKCQRAPRGITAETEDGDIFLAVVGPSTAIVKNGYGRIDADGVRDTLAGTTSAGEIHVKAVPHQDWMLSSVSGTIRLELPPAVGYYLDAVTGSGELMVRRDDLDKANSRSRRLAQEANTGGKRIEVRTETGNIVID
jgi:hypothetical protein